MKIKHILITFILIISIKTNTHSQYVNLYEIKYTLNTKFNKINLEKIIDLLEDYRNGEIEVLTLEMKKIGNNERIIRNGKIYFGNSTYYDSYKNLDFRVNNNLKEDDLYFSKKQSQKMNDKFKTYHSLDLYINKETLYNTIVEIGNRNDYKIITSKLIDGGIIKIFEFIPKEKTKGFLIQTYDGDEISKISFMLSY